MALSLAIQKVSGEEAELLTFDGVYRRHAATVARWAARLLGPGGDVEDLTQEVFVVVNRRLNEFRGDARLTTWLFRITDGLAANQRRRGLVRRWLSHLTPDIERHATSPDPSPLEQLERRERRIQFYDVLDRLRANQRKVLILFELEEMSTDEIAALLGIKLGNVRVLLHRARAAFLEQLTKMERQERT